MKHETVPNLMSLEPFQINYRYYISKDISFFTRTLHFSLGNLAVLMGLYPRKRITAHLNKYVGFFSSPTRKNCISFICQLCIFPKSF